MHSEDSEDSKTDSENDPETNTEADSENDSETDTETDLEADPVLVDSFTKRNDGKEVIANLLSIEMLRHHCCKLCKHRQIKTNKI